jgi:thiosulfate/3-mercaptopyruvate sulfurtransferase
MSDATPIPAILSAEALRGDFDSFILLDARPGPDAYAKGHLPNARHADLNLHLSRASEADFDPAMGGRHPLPSLKAWSKQLGAWGIGADSRVVIYDDQSGANAAARAWWMLRAIGHESVQVLDGGLQAALAAGLKLTTEKSQVQPRGDYFAPRWLSTVAEMDIVEKLAQHQEWKVLDVRASVRYRGETEPIDPIAGHIPGALNVPFAENLKADGSFKSIHELQSLYEAFLGETRTDHLVVHCGSGVTACHTLLALEHAGFRGAALYVGSWSEWCRNEKPLAKGDQP